MAMNAKKMYREKGRENAPDDDDAPDCGAGLEKKIDPAEVKAVKEEATKSAVEVLTLKACIQEAYKNLKKSPGNIGGVVIGIVGLFIGYYIGRHHPVAEPPAR